MTSYVGYHHLKAKVRARAGFSGRGRSDLQASNACVHAHTLPLSHQHPPRPHPNPCTPLGPQGWLPRSGLLYGIDLVAYQRHPAAMHAEYGVLVVPVADGPHRPELGWRDLNITNRLVNQARGGAGGWGWGQGGRSPG